MPMTVAALAEAIGASTTGDASALVARVAGIDSAARDAVVFAMTEALLERAETSGAGAVITGRFAEGRGGRCPILAADNPKLAFARAARLLAGGSLAPGSVHPTAAVSPSAVIGERVAIGPHAVVGDGAVLGDRTSVAAGVVIGDGVRIGADCRLYPNVVIYSGTSLGCRVVVHAGTVLGSDGFGYVRDEKTGAYEQFPQIGTLTIGDDVEIGANTAVDRGALGSTVIGCGSKIDNLVQVAHNVEIGSRVAVSAQTGIAGSARVGDDAILAGQVGIADHACVESGVIMGAQSGVPTNKVVRGRGEVFFGTPARPIRQALKEMATLARLARRRGRE
jgi:UDP-3-O-[3-hydroxymyristoyl] glucosamine N-acyltransferase